MGACDQCKAYIGPLRDEVIQVFNDLEIEEVSYYQLATPHHPFPPTYTYTCLNSRWNTANGHRLIALS